MTDTTSPERPIATAEAPPAPAGRARWSRLASLALILVACAPILMLAAGLAWRMDLGAEIVFFGITAALPLLGAALVQRRHTGWKVGGLVLGLLAGAGLFWTAFGLAAPNSFFDFVPGVLVLPGLLLAIVATVATIRADRRGDRTPALVGGERGAVLGMAGVVALLAAMSAIVSVTGRETVGDTSGVAETVVLKDFEFAADSYELTGGTTILVRNDDPFLHTFTVDRLGIDVTFGPGSEKLIDIPAEPGEYVLYCAPHTGDKEDPGDDDMAARLRVR